MNELENKINSWHEEAMDLAEMAFFAKKRSELYSYWKYIHRALNYEKASARTLMNELKLEPTRSILFQSATYLALNLDLFDEARQLIREALEGNPPLHIKEELEKLNSKIQRREEIRSKSLAISQVLLDKDELTPEDVNHAMQSSFAALERQFGKETVDEFLNRIAIEVFLESKNIVSNPDYQIFEDAPPLNKNWINDKKGSLTWSFWKAYKVYLDKKKFASTTIKKLDLLTDDILTRIGDPSKGGKWEKKGMVVGDVQSGKTSNYVGLINKAADLGFRIVIIFSGLYENLRQQTQERIDEGFTGYISDLKNPDVHNPIGVELYRTPKKLPVHPITRAGEAGDLRKSALPNLPITTNDYYAIVAKKNPAVLKTLLNWLHTRAESDGNYKIIKNIPLLVIDDEADYASINIDKEFVSQINGSIRATLSLFEQSAFVGYTATPFANVFISDYNETEGKEMVIEGKKYKLGADLFPKDFIINLPPPSNYIGYSKVFDTKLKTTEEYNEGDLPMINIINDYESYIPQGHSKDDELPSSIPPSMQTAINAFIIVCAIRSARGEPKEHNSMLVHVSWYVKWIDMCAYLIYKYTANAKKLIVEQEPSFISELKSVWEKEFKNQTANIIKQLDYNDPLLIEHTWDEIQPFLLIAIQKIEVRAVHGAKKDLVYANNTPLNYKDYVDGLYVIAVGGNKLSRGLTLEGLSISYFLRASRFYDTLLQMGRWFGYRPGYADLCRLFTTEELITWYQYIANATDELKEQFDMMELADRTPENFGLKVRSAPGMLMISSAAKIKGATDLSFSFSGDLIETYMISKSEDSLRKNLHELNNLVEKLGSVSGIIRQMQPYIWENIKYSQIDDFIANYRIKQLNINTNYIRGYIGQQLKHGNLNNWTVVLINNSKANQVYEIKTSNGAINVGCTFRKEVIEEDASGNLIIDQQKYIIRKSHIISPPHEYLDMEETDKRYIDATILTQNESKAKTPPQNPVGKYIRKYRGSANALLLIYVLDTDGFGGSTGLPAIGYALSFPEIENDEKIPYKVNQQFLENMFAIPEDAEEDPEEDVS